MANTNNDSADNNPDSPREAGLEKSFVGKVVSGLINSTPLSKWFSKEPKSGVRKRDDDDEELDATYTFQPPTKRTKLPVESQRNNHSAHIFESPVTVHNASNNVNKIASKVYGKFPEPVPGPSGIKSRKLFEKQNTASTNTLSTNSFESRDVINGGDNSDSEESTSGYSSAPRLVSKSNDDASKNKEAHDKLTPTTRSLFTSSNESNFGRSLFSDRSPQLNTSLSSRRPTFNTSTFGSPNFVDRTLSTERILSSPFYSGNTIYGGASAYGRKFGRNADESRATVQIKPVNEKTANETVTLSKTARRILNTLEQYSTPIRDAKKIPVTPRKQGLLSQYVGATPYLVRDRRKASNKELQVPSVPELLQMKQKERLQNSTETVRQIATKSKLTLNDKEEYSLPKEQDDKQKHSNKMKSSIVVSVRQKNVPSDEPVSVVKLPKVSLPITTLPKFDFVMMPPSTASKVKVTSSETSRIINVTKSPLIATPKPILVTENKETEKRIVENGKTHYTFSEPLVILNNVKPVAAINCFKFSEPLCTKHCSEKGANIMSEDKSVKSPGVKPKNNGDAVIVKDLPKLTNKVMEIFQKGEGAKITETWECAICLHKNDTNKVKCEACHEPQTEIDSRKKSPSGFGDKFKMSSDKWECSACLVRNSNSDTRCVACATAKPGAVKPAVQSGFGDKFKMSTDKWVCPACLVPNYNTEMTCVACTSPKPGAAKPAVQSGFGDRFKPPSSTWECSSCLIRNGDDLKKCQACGSDKAPPKLIVNDLGSKFKPASDTWECDTCMIRNKNTVSKCAACETPKPASNLTPKTKPNYLFKSFDFMIYKDWECPKCLIKHKDDVLKCPGCGMSNNNIGTIFKTQKGEWECGSCLVKNKAVSSACVCCGGAKPGSTQPIQLDSKTEDNKPINSFNFGIDKSGTFKFGIPSTSSETKITPVSTQSALIFGGAKSATESTPNTFSFGINNTQEKVTPNQTVVSTSESLEIASSNPLLKPNEKLPEKAAPAAAGFKFGLDSSLVKNPVSSEAVVSSSQSDTTTTSASSFGNKSIPMFEFKPPTINGDVNKPKQFTFGNETRKTTGSLLFGDGAPKPKKFSHQRTSPPRPLEATIKLLKRAVPEDQLKSKDRAFENKPIEPMKRYPFLSAPAPIFNYKLKPDPSIKDPLFTSTGVPIFKFGDEVPSNKQFGEATGSNGFGAGAKFPTFGISQTFGTTETPQNQSFAPYVPAEPPKNAGFSFSVAAAAADKPNSAAAAPVFNFGSGAPSNANSVGGFNFSAPTTGFNFGSAAKVENSTFTPVASSGPAAAKNGSFNFGTNANNNNQKAVFSFGANQPSQAAFPAPSQPGFNFGASTPVGPPQTGGFNFSAPPPTFNFDASSTTAQPQRKIKKALRRTHR